MQANAELNKIALLIQQNQWQAAEKMLQALLRKSPQHAVAHRLLGDCLLARQQWRPALEVYQRSLSLRMSAEALIGMGKAADMLRINEVAEKCYRTALAQLPKSAELKYRLGVLLGGSRDGAEEALQLLGAAIEQGFQPARAYLHISQLAERWLKNFDMAFNAASKALDCAVSLGCGASAHPPSRTARRLSLPKTDITPHPTPSAYGESASSPP